MEKSHTRATHERTVRGRRFSDRLIAGVLRVFSRIHLTIYRWTDGIIGGRIFGNRMLLLTTTGRKTGQPRTTPVGYLTDGDALVIVGGAAGAAKQPAWWLNLESHPEAQVQVGRRKLRVSATRALPEEQQRLWARYPAQHALFDKMQKRVSREIPAKTKVFRCLQHIICSITRVLSSKRRYNTPNGLMNSSIHSRAAMRRSRATAFIISTREDARLSPFPPGLRCPRRRQRHSSMVGGRDRAMKPTDVVSSESTKGRKPVHQLVSKEMTEGDIAMESFETYRSYLFAIAYRMLGSAMDAEDMVQETNLRYQSTPKDSITSLKAFLTTIITLLCVDQLHLARRKREQYLGPWLPEPIITADTREVISPEERVEEEETISIAFLLLLEQLQPVERAVFLLREVFDYDYAEIASFLGKSEVACRQWFSRAKKHLGDHRPRFSAPPETQKQLLISFQQALRGGEMTALLNMLAEDVTFWADGGGKVKGVATQLLSGRDVVASFILSNSPIFRNTLPADSRVELSEVNGQPGLITRSGDRAFAVLTIDVEADQIKAIRFVANPDKLAHI
jgi:RNA polymerase sigma-70 factor (ECF subfamily)